MSKLPEAVVEAAFDRDDTLDSPSPEDRARRVILALADHLPESAVEKAWEAHCNTPKTRSIDGWRVAMRAAIVDALKDVGGK